MTAERKDINPQWTPGTPEFVQRHKNGGYKIWQEEKGGVPQGRAGQDADYFESINRDLNADRQVEEMMLTEGRKPLVSLLNERRVSQQYGPGWKSPRTPNDWEKQSEVKKNSGLEKPENILLDWIVEVDDKIKTRIEEESAPKPMAPLKTAYEVALEKTNKLNGEEKSSTKTSKEVSRKGRLNGSYQQDIEEQLRPEHTKVVVEKYLDSDNVKFATKRAEEISKQRQEGKFKQSIAETTEAKKIEDAPKPAEKAAKPKTVEELRKEFEDLRTKAQEIANQIAQAQAGEQKTEATGTAKPAGDEAVVLPKIKIGPATWNGLSIEVTEPAGKGPDGKDYVRIKGSEALIPLDEIKYPKEEEGKRAEKKITPEEEAKIKLETALKESEEKGKKEGKDDLWNELKRKRTFKEKVKTLFKRNNDPKTEAEKVEQYKTDIYRTYVLAGVGGAVAALLGVGIAQYFGYFLPVPVKDLYINAYNKLIPLHK